MKHGVRNGRMPPRLGQLDIVIGSHPLGRHHDRRLDRAQLTLLKPDHNTPGWNTRAYNSEPQSYTTTRIHQDGQSLPGDSPAIEL